MNTPETADRDVSHRFDETSWAVLAGAIGYIVACIIYVLLAYQQPSDGWLYSSGLGLNTIALLNQSNRPSVLQVGDIILTVDGYDVATFTYRPLPPLQNRHTGGTAHYVVLRNGTRTELEVPLVTRPASALLSYIWGWSGDAGWPLLKTLVWYGLGFAVFLIRPRDTAARLLLLILVYWTTYDTIISAEYTVLLPFYPALLFWFRHFIEALWPFLFAMATHLILVLPVRKWPLRSHPRLTLALLYGIPLAGVMLVYSLSSDTLLLITLFSMMAAMLISLVAVTIHNLRTLRDPVARAQVSWLGFGLVVPFLGAIILQLTLFLQIIANNNYYEFVWQFLALVLPVCLAIAITRYRLFDIELVIRRTLIYSLLSGLLVAIYFASVIAIQTVLRPVIGLGSEPAIVLSTLVVAALFTPLRRGIQSVIDRRFYRRKYDAAKTLAAFSARLRNQVNLEELQADVVGVAQATLQPRSVSLWLREPSKTQDG